jgi:hypothetical protein
VCATVLRTSQSTSDGPVPRNERLERLEGGGGGLEKVVGCRVHDFDLAITQAYPYINRLAGLVKYRQGW